MRSILFEDFEMRAKEVSKYFLFLKNLEQGSIRLNMPNIDNPEKYKNKQIDYELEKTLKATGFLLLYNLVESTMTNAIETIFNEIKENEISFDDVHEELKKLIINNFKNNYSENNISEINIISQDIITASFNKKKLFSGNVDARKIQKTAMAYGFSVETNARKTENGQDLLRIKTNRNDLAHGSKSFEEVGKDATADELLVIRRRVICYLREILKNIETYISNEEYLNNRI